MPRKCVTSWLKGVSGRSRITQNCRTPSARSAAEIRGGMRADRQRRLLVGGFSLIVSCSVGNIEPPCTTLPEQGFLLQKREQACRCSGRRWRLHAIIVLPQFLSISAAVWAQDDLLAHGRRAEGPLVLPAQGAALGNGRMSTPHRPNGPTVRSGEPLARWADMRGVWTSSPGRRPGLEEPLPLRGDCTVAKNIRRARRAS
jgi:hypothetical protein